MELAVISVTVTSLGGTVGIQGRLPSTASMSAADREADKSRLEKERWRDGNGASLLAMGKGTSVCAKLAHASTRKCVSKLLYRNQGEGEDAKERERRQSSKDHIHSYQCTGDDRTQQCCQTYGSISSFIICFPSFSQTSKQK